MNSQIQQNIQPQSDSTDIIAMVLEIIFGLFGILGVGWLYVGNFLVGGLLFVGWFLVLGAILLLFTVFSTVTLGIGTLFACCIPPISISIAVISGIKVRDHVRNTGVRGNFVLLFIPIIIGCVAVSLIAISILGTLGVAGSAIIENAQPFAYSTPVTTLVTTPVVTTPISTLFVPTRVPPTENSALDPASPTTAPDSTPASEGQTEFIPPDTMGDLFAPFWEVWRIVNENFVDRPLDHAAMLQGALEGLVEASELSNIQPSVESARSFATAAGTPDDLVEVSLPFWQTWIRTVAAQDETLMRVAINGMLAALGDQHTSYMDPDQFTQANIPLAGEYEGIGAFVDPDGEFLTIISPMPDSPAEAAGLEPGDQVIKVDGEDMTGIDGTLVIRRVLGAAGSQVTLTIRREGIEEFDVTITRAKIVIPSVTGKMLEENNIAYVQLFNFGQDTSSELRVVLEELLAQNPRGLILDLRNNGGGFLRTAIEIASEFIDDGVIMYEVYGDGKRETHESLGNGLATTIPMVVLINEGSASASEILAGAIQDYARAPLVGTTSFGKGSVQNWIELTSEDGAVRVTIARWYTPNERLIHEIGLTPDVVVEFTEADVEAKIDPQLDKAIEILLNP